jgi:hypothetical protein
VTDGEHSVANEGPKRRRDQESGKRESERERERYNMAHTTYEQIARKVAAYAIFTREADVIVEVHDWNTIEDGVWLVHIWEGLPARGIKVYIGPDDALRRIAETVHAHATSELLTNAQGEPVLETVTSAITGDESDDAEDADPLHVLTVYPEGTFNPAQ